MTKETNETLLIRIDERQKEMSKKLDNISNGLSNKIDCEEFEQFKNKEFKELKDKMSTLWDERNKLIGLLLACGIIGGTTGAMIKQVVSSVFAR
jgi:hypothetical protein